MIAKYYAVLKHRLNENHAVHKEGCPFLHDDEKSIYLGEFSSGQDAVNESQRFFSRTKGCIFCSEDHNLSDNKPILSERVIKEIIPAKIEKPISYLHNLFCCLN